MSDLFCCLVTSGRLRSSTLKCSNFAGMPPLLLPYEAISELYTELLLIYIDAPFLYVFPTSPPPPPPSSFLPNARHS